MEAKMPPGGRLRAALKKENPLQIVGVINALCALLAKEAGFQALYLSGAGVSNAQFGLPDLGLTSLTEVAEETRRITACVDTPLLVDADTGWGSVLTVARTVTELQRAGAAGLHLEDQNLPKRCGHRENKKLISSIDMVDKIKAATDARTDASFVIMARTDAITVEGVSHAVERARHYAEAGADMIFVEAPTRIEEYAEFSKALSVPILANMTEFGKTPLFTVEELKAKGVQLVLYPLSAFRVMNKAAENLYKTLRTQGTQKEKIKDMQTRDELYALLHYTDYEGKI